MKKKTEFDELLLRKKPAKLLISLNTEEHKYVTVLAKEIDCTYSHVVKLLDIFAKLGIVRYKKEGRVKYTTLTEEGKEIAKTLDTLMKKLSKLPREEKKAAQSSDSNK
ncbi:MAG: hypothetical protein QXZ20_00545 [Candidatus Aenigmatarchaeota archaeon]